MAEYLLLESRDPFASNEVAYYYDLASSLAREGNTVTLMLIQNGVLPARRSAASEKLSAVAASGVEVLADEYSLRERGIRAEQLHEDVKPTSLDVVIDHLAQGRKAMWH